MTRTTSAGIPWILGIDLGANSLGWVALRCGPDGEPAGLLHPASDMRDRPTIGVRIFDEGVENYGRGEREQSRAVKRRIARLQRRQTMRRARRMTKVFNILQGAGLLPSFSPVAAEAAGSCEAARDELLKGLDVRLTEWTAGMVPAPQASRVVELLPYALRSLALRSALDTHALGRAFYHLAQRRGFKSNRKTAAKESDQGEVKQAITQLASEIEQAGPEATLGSYLYTRGMAGERIRRRWTSRSMYEAEFDRIWSFQAIRHPQVLTEALRVRLRQALFHQRPLKDQSALIGTCEHESGAEYRDEHGAVRRTRRRRRAPECLLISQRFRIWQTLNNIRVRSGPDRESPLDDEQRQRLFKELDCQASMTLASAKRVLGLGAKVKLNLQEAGVREIRGNRTNHALLGIFGDRWKRLNGEAQDTVVWDVWNAIDDDSLVKQAEAHAGVWASLRPTRSEARALTEIVISGDYMSLSRQAMERLLPQLEAGVTYSRAVIDAYGTLVAREPQAFLPPVNRMFKELRNPAVSRALNELRRVVNTLVREYGKPDKVRIELARDLKRGKEDRKRIQEEIERNESIRQRARNRLLDELGRSNPSGEDVLRMRLFDECNGQCPYTGRQIGMSQLLSGEVDIEHIIPFSRCLDDSFTNLTLCFSETNRTVKQNRTPFEAFGHDKELWDAMVDRMRKHVSDRRMSEGKLRRFLMTPEEQAEFLAGFTSSQLNDTRHASLRAREYIATLYGGDLGRGVDPNGRVRVQVGNGSLTALIRRAYGIDRLLPTPPGQKRLDHRHHAIDAVAIALTSPASAKRMSSDAEERWNSRRRRLSGLPDPWPAFVEDIKATTAEITPSFRIDNRVRGPLHMETIYSPRRDEGGEPREGGACSHVRKPVEQLSPKDMSEIVDGRIREVVRAFFGGRDPKKVCVRGDASTYPRLIAKDGRAIPIYRVRIRKHNTTYVVGAGERARQVENADNHHLVVKDVVDRGGQKRVAYEVVSMMQAYRRKAAEPRQEIVNHDPAIRFTLRKNDVFELSREDAQSQLCRVLRISEKEFEGCAVTDARDFHARKEERVRISPAKWSKGASIRKLVVSPIGVIRPSRA